jgi:sigma-B regulation protein RsbU (phosphoserine phosphatase)
MCKFISIRIKILAIVVVFFSLIAIAFTIYSIVTTDNYKQLRTDEILGIVAYESERVNKTIAEMERNAIDLALAGQQFYNAGASTDAGISVSVENFRAFSAAIGGGIWYEPYVLHKDRYRVCYYAFKDHATGGVRYDSSFESDEYDYHTQIWYKQIKAGVKSKFQTVWTVPYYDESGSLSLMTTVGAGIYDVNGNFVGLSTVDWEIQNVVERLSAIKPTKNSFALLASPKDDYVISNKYESDIKVGSSFSALPWYKDISFSGDDVYIGKFIHNSVDYISFSRILGNDWLFSIQIPSGEIFAEVEKKNNEFAMIIGLSALFLLFMASALVSMYVIHPLRSLTAQVAAINGGNLDKQINIHSKDEIGTLAASFNKMMLDLKTSIEESARERAERERIGAELNIAKQIQSSMLPCLFPPFPHKTEFDIYAFMLPAKEVGGDFYDFFLIDETKLAVVIADVSGKGVPAALFMVIAKTLIKNNTQYGKSLKDVFETVNKMLCENNEICMFVTVFMGILDISSGVFEYINAGHTPPLIKRAGENFEQLTIRPGFVLACMEDSFYEQDKIQLMANDTLFFYTDGVTEAVDEENNMFGDAKLLEVSNAHKNCEPKELLLSIKSEIDVFAGRAEQADDITMLVLKIKGESL